MRPITSAFQLLKEDNPPFADRGRGTNVPEDFGRFFDKDYRYEQTYGDLRNNQEVPMKDARFGPSSDERDQMMASTKRNIVDNVDRLQHEEFDGRENYLTRPLGDMSNEKLRERLILSRPYVRDAEGRITPVPLSDDGKRHQRFHPNSSPDRWILEQEIRLRELESQPTMFYEEHPFSQQFQDLYRSEPMDIAFQLLKERKSPEAMRRKLEYDKRYEKTPERRKYQRDLHAERRRRGIYGSGDHMDVSHTEGGKLTLEGEHSNRARHFKNRGTLRRVRN